MADRQAAEAREPNLVFNWVRVTVEIDGEEKVLGQEMWGAERDESPEDVAAVALAAWDKAREQAERTLRLYGVEGVIRAVFVKEKT